MALKRIWIPSPCYSGRNYNDVRVIVMHTAEGARTYQDLGHYFQNAANQVSSHTGLDDTLGTIGEYVSRGNKAWTQANYNPYAVAAELCGFAAWTTDQWKNQHHNMLVNAADWIREECGKAGIPIDRLTDSQAQGNGRGCCQHINLGAGGGGHVDCGPGFPFDYVINLALGNAPDSTPKADECEDDGMFYLQFGVNADGTIRNDSSIVFTNDQKDGKHRIRFGCRVTQTLRVDPTVGPSWSATIGYQDAEGLTIPRDCNSAVIHVDEPCDLREPIAVSIGKQ